MSQTDLLKLDRVQNEAMIVILGTTKDTPTETMRFMLDLPPMQTREKVKLVKTFFSAVEKKHSPLHEAVKDTKGSRLGRGKSWKGQAEKSTLQVCQLTELTQNKEWEHYPNRFRHHYQTLLPENLGRHSREWPAGKADSEIRHLARESRRISYSTLMAQSPKTSQGGASLLSEERPPPTKTVQPMRSQPPA